MEGDTKMKRIQTICNLLLAVIVFISNSRVVFANSCSEYDYFLASAGVPQNIICCISEEQKMVICQTLGEDAVFEGYDTQTFVETNGSVVNGGAQMFSANIPSSELTISVLGFSINYNGQPCYAIYPSFVWNTISKLSNDSFAMAMYDGWEAIPNCNNLEVYLKNSQGTSVQHTSVSAAVSASSGYSYIIPGSVGNMDGLYEGHAYLYAKKTNASATHAISLNYVDDTSRFMNVSYGINIGPASISVTSTDSNLRFMSGNFSF